MNKVIINGRLTRMALAALLFAASVLYVRADVATGDVTVDNSVASAESRAGEINAVRLLNPVGYWPCDEGSGEVLNDRSGHNNHGLIRHVPWKDGLLDFTSAYQWLEIPPNTLFQSKEMSFGGWVFSRSATRGGNWPNQNGFMFIGNGYSDWSNYKGIQLCVRRDELIDVVINGKGNVGQRTNEQLGKTEGKPVLALGKWQHLFYSYSNGRGRLYLDGRVVLESENLTYDPVNRPLRIGNDASWWHQSIKPGALNGSVHGLAWFDRALSADEIATLIEETRPERVPAERVPVAGPVPESRSVAELVAIVEDANRSESERAKAVLELASKKDAATALPILVKQLNAMPSDSVPKVEQLLRNACIKVLLKITPDDALAREALGVAFAKPILNQVDLSRPGMEKIAELVRDEHYMDALALYRKSSDRLRFFPGKDPSQRDYTATVHHKGFTYKVGEGEAWKGVEPISPADFTKAVEEISAKYPEANTWRKADAPNLYRVPIRKIAPDGSEQKVYLEGPNFILDGTDGKLRAWSMFIDKAGYIHLMGGQHNGPDPGAYIPGSWEKMGLSRSKGNPKYPAQLYWVSKQPESIEEFEFAGFNDSPRAIPASYLNYMVFVTDRVGNVFLYGRTEGIGWQSWGLFGYDADAKTWSAIGGDPRKVIASARAADPAWMNFLHDNIRGNIASEKEDKVLAWSWQPAFYNFCRDEWGVQFDPSNRMHVMVNMFGLNREGYNRAADLYAWSDDGGRSFHRADGSRVELPLSANPAPEHEASLDSREDGLWLSVWLSLLRDAGYEGVPPDRNGKPLQSEAWWKK